MPAGAQLLRYLRTHRVPFLIILPESQADQCALTHLDASPAVLHHLLLSLWDWNVFTRVLEQLLRALFQVIVTAVELSRGSGGQNGESSDCEKQSHVACIQSPAEWLLRLWSSAFKEERQRDWRLTTDTSRRRN